MSSATRNIFKSICGRTGRGVTGGAERSPWVTDIHNGIYNPNFTYTGGQAIVPDENGILRRTPAGYPAVEGGRWAATVAEGALLGPELVANGGFDSGTDWTLGANTTVSGGTLNVVAESSASTYPVTVTPWSWYQITYTIVSVTSGGALVRLGGTASGTLRNTPGTYTESLQALVAGSVIVADVAGARFIGSIDNISVRKIIPQWYAPTLGATSNISTRKGLRTIQTADTFEGMLVEPAMTNKVTARKSNPTDTTGVTGAGGATVTRVLDTAALTAGGYQDICTTFYDYELSIPQNGTISMAGAVANLNKHSVSLDMRLVSGTGVQFGLTGQTSDVTLTAAFSRQVKENLTPLNAADVITITNLNADTAVVRCILPGLEENAFCTSRIAPAADTAASQTRAASVPSASTSGVFPSTGQDFAVFMRVVPEAAEQNVKSIISSRVLSTDEIKLVFFPTKLTAVIRKSGFADTLCDVTYSHNTLVSLQVVYIKTSSGMSLKVRKYSGGVWGAWVGWTSNISTIACEPAPIGDAYYIGSLAGVNQFAANYPLTAIIQMPTKATLAEYQTWVEEELTRRGLI